MGYSGLTDDFLVVKIKVPKTALGLEKSFDYVSD